MFTTLLLWILFSLASSQPSLKMASAKSDNTTCNPFRLLVIWHTSNGEDHAFIEQKRFIIQLLTLIPQGTEIQVTAINTQLNHLLYLKKNKTTDWIYSISMYMPEILEIHSIKDSLIKETVFNFRKKNDKKELAEFIVLVVSAKTLTENSLETIKNTKRCVVFTGLNPPPQLWTSLATDRQYIVMLNKTYENIEANINGAAEPILDILCRDSSLICDTDKFWTRKRCVSCSYICSADSKKHADMCLDLCPYYRQLPSENADNEVEENITGESCKQTLVWILLSLSYLVLVLTVCLLAWRYFIASFKRTHLNKKTYRTNERNGSSSNDPSSEFLEVKVGIAPKMSDQVFKATEGALWGMLISDALSMPVHWYYNPSDIKRGYGSWLTGYVAPNQKHPSSILSLSAVDGSGRTGWHSKSKPIIGSVILHDKLKYWQGDRSTHYHQGMKAGENTLNAVMALRMLKTLQRVDPKVSQPSRDVRGLVLEDYVKFMTTPGSHNDTYAESFHRSFFRDWSAQDQKLFSADKLLEFSDNRYKENSKGPGDSQLVVIGAMSPALPWIIRNAHRSEDDCAREAIDFVKCTHPVPALVPFVDLYARLLHGVINGRDLKQEAVRALSHSELGGPQKREMVLALVERAQSYPKGSEERLKAYQMATQTLGSACYVEGAMSSMLFLAYEFADDFQAGVLNNANCGGENCHRGAALGALLGANAMNKGRGIPESLKDGLQARSEVISLLQQMEAARKS